MRYLANRLARSHRDKEICEAIKGLDTPEIPEKARFAWFSFPESGISVQSLALPIKPWVVIVLLALLIFLSPKGEVETLASVIRANSSAAAAHRWNPTLGVDWAYVALFALPMVIILIIAVLAIKEWRTSRTTHGFQGLLTVLGLLAVLFIWGLILCYTREVPWLAFSVGTLLLAVFYGVLFARVADELLRQSTVTDPRKYIHHLWRLIVVAWSAHLIYYFLPYQLIEDYGHLPDWIGVVLGIVLAPLILAWLQDMRQRYVEVESGRN